jgi:predicted 2-oxoglutarate/Fe(II)-dependent dioxygenase YbiX
MRVPLVVPSFLSKFRCEECISFFHTEEPKPRSYQGIVDGNVRHCDYVVATCLEGDFRLLMTRHVESYFCVVVGALAHSPLIYRYPIGAGFTTHHDRVTTIESERSASTGQPVVGGDFTMVLALNDPNDYGGGELFFPELGLALKPSAGSAVVFPATEEYMHRVAPVTSGERFTAVARCFLCTAGCPA